MKRYMRVLWGKKRKSAAGNIRRKTNFVKSVLMLKIVKRVAMLTLAERKRNKPIIC